MEAGFSIGDATVYTGNVLKIIKQIPDGSVHCVCTSPPYFGLRDYGTATWDGGDPACDHLPNNTHQRQGQTGERANRSFTGFSPFRDTCGKCGAARVDEQIGLEETPQEYVEKLVAVFAEVRRVLHTSGVVWLNLGDSYNAQPNQRKTSDEPGEKQATNEGSVGSPSRSVPGLKPKNLIGIPWRVAFALQDDGWYLRSDIIWHKPNAMPESVQDRCSKQHEYIFMLAKSESYFYDNVAIFEPAVSGHASGNKARKPATARGCPQEGVDGSVPWEGETRNKRTVWSIPTQPYKGAHFAVWPSALVKPMILAGTSAHGVCPKCLSPWERVVEKDRQPTRPRADTKVIGDVLTHGNRDPERHCTSTVTLGWEPTCSCDGEPIPATVLDTFAGSGTTLVEACKHNRHAIGIELNPEYVKLIRERLLEFQADEVGMFAGTAP